MIDLIDHKCKNRRHVTYSENLTDGSVKRKKWCSFLQLTSQEVAIHF